MKNKALLVLCLNFLIILSVLGQTKTVELKDHFFYIDDQKTFLKGINYETGAIPGQNPWERSLDQELIEFDMDRIRSAGFNTIRTWGISTEEELEILKNFDINILMGIWIGDGNDFSDPDFVSLAISNVNYVLSYSKNYDNIIGYLIQNEPLPEAIFSSGYTETQYLWQTLTEIIHNEHPGRPVSISNTCVGSYIDPAFFDFSAYNVYPYNPATVNYSHGYAGYIEFIKELQNNDAPLIITEFGLSVSPTGPGNWGYGGNTLQEQEDGILNMYSSLLDGGASGGSVFIYSDSWWKNGDPSTHDDSAEEWFGLINYTAIDDKYGEERQAWEAVKKYQYAIVSSPRNSVIYTNKVFIEIFSEIIADTVKVFEEENIIYKNALVNGYLNDTIEFSVIDYQDKILDFKFYDSNAVLIKEESISCLICNEEIELPYIEITTESETFSGSGNILVTFSVTNNPVFSTDGDMQYVYYPHQGWDYGDTFSVPMSLNANSFEFSRNFNVSSLTNVISFAAGFDISYGNFTKRIHANKTFIKDDLNYLPEKNTFYNNRIIIYPNPSSDYILFKETNISIFHLYNYKITDLQGKLLLSGQAEANHTIDIQQLENGFFIIALENEKHQCYYKTFIKK